MGREFKEMEIARIVMSFKVGSADLTIFTHVLSTYGGQGSCADRVGQLSTDEFENFYTDMMKNWSSLKQGKATP